MRTEKVRSITPTSTTWSAREVARAILIDATGNEMLAERLCRPFTWEVVSKLPADEFRVARADVLAWVEGRPALAAPRRD